MTWIIAIGMFLLGFIVGVLATSLGSAMKIGDLEMRLIEERMRREKEADERN
jgi:hypothetical protein